MYHVNAQGVDQRMVNVLYYYYCCCCYYIFGIVSVCSYLYTLFFFFLIPGMNILGGMVDDASMS